MAMKYVGDGAWIHGVPARDLSDDEEAKYAGVIKDQERLSGVALYQKVAAPKAAPSTKEPEKSGKEEK